MDLNGTVVCHHSPNTSEFCLSFPSWNSYFTMKSLLMMSPHCLRFRQRAQTGLPSLGVRSKGCQYLCSKIWPLLGILFKETELPELCHYG